MLSYPTKRSRAYIILPVLWMGLIFYLSSLTQNDLSERGWTLDLWDKLQHCIAYGILAMLWVLALSGGFRKSPPWKIAFWAFVLTIVYGATDEFHQLFVETRQTDLADWIADACGATIVFLWAIVGRFGSRS